jgi:hypothetical protein
MDIQLQYRITTASFCDASDAFTGPGTQWRDLDGSPDGFFSLHGSNEQELQTGLVARCFQYRARLTTTGSPPTQTPSLLNLSIEIYIPGSPDLQVKTLADRRNATGALTGLNVVILNQNNTANQETLPAAVNDTDYYHSFFVDLLVYGPAATAPNPSNPTLPLTGTAPENKAYVNLLKGLMAPDSELSITQWCDAANENSCQQINLLSLFRTPGWYTVIVVVDSYGCAAPAICVDETEATEGGESNNISRVSFEVKDKGGGVGDVSYDTSLPMLKAR